MHIPLSLLPPVYEDEALGHYVLRVQALTCGFSYRAVTKSLFGIALNHVDWALPSNVAQFAETCNLLTQGPNAEYWLLHHTLFPYYAAVATPALISKLRSRMLMRQIGPMRQWQALTASEAAHRYARYCPICAKSDIERLGTPYVRTFHLLPYLTYCHIHGEVLRKVGESHLTSVLVEKTQSVFVHGQELMSEQRFAVESVRLFREGPDTRDAYFNALQAAGWWGNSKILRRGLMKKMVSEHWHGDFLNSSLQKLLQTEDGVARLLACFGHDRKLVHPVAAIAIRSACESKHLFLTPPVAIGAAPLGDYQVRLNSALRVFDLGATLSHAAQSAQISVTGLATAAEASGRSVCRRPKLLTSELVAQIGRVIAHGDNLVDIAKSFGVSLSSVYRIRAVLLKSNPELQAEQLEHKVHSQRLKWLDKCAQHSSLTISQVRALSPATYAWLYRHDRNWIVAQNSQRQMPPRTDVHHQRGPRLDISTELESAVIRILRGRKRPIRVTKAAAHKEAGFTYVWSQAHYSCPIDTQTSFLFRRIRWARNELSRKGCEPKPWQILRKTGMRQAAWAGLKADRLYGVMQARRPSLSLKLISHASSIPTLHSRR